MIQNAALEMDHDVFSYKSAVTLLESLGVTAPSLQEVKETFKLDPEQDVPDLPVNACNGDWLVKKEGFDQKVLALRAKRETQNLVAV